MKKSFKGVKILFASAMLGIFSASNIMTASAAPPKTTLYDVVNSGIKIVVNNKRIEPVDTNGNKIEPLIYNGVLYLPARTVASALEKDVSWDGVTYTCYINDMKGDVKQPTILLKDMMKTDLNQMCVSRDIGDNCGNRYENSMQFKNIGDTASEFSLDAKYSSFKMVLYVAEGTNNDGNETFSIEADGKVIYTSPKMTKNSAPVNIDIDVTGYHAIKLVKTGNFNNLRIGNAGFYQYQ